MTTGRSAAEVLQEREEYPFGKPRPYAPGHRNVLAEGLYPAPPVARVRMHSTRTRWLLCLAALGVAMYGLHGLVTDDLYLPAKRSPGTHFHGAGAWLMFGMLMSFAGWLAATAFGRIDAAGRRASPAKLSTFLLAGAVCFMLAGLSLRIANG